MNLQKWNVPVANLYTESEKMPLTENVFQDRINHPGFNFLN